MDNNYLAHHGIKGQKWGVRRYQTKDGSLTSAGKKRYSKGDGKKAKKTTPEETVEQKRARLLKSSDPHELYSNKHLLTTNEINERLVRIDTEKRLASVAASEKRGFAKFMDKAGSVVKTANDLYAFTQTPLAQAIAAKLKGEETPSEPKFDRDSVESILKNKSKISDKDMESLVKRRENVKKLQAELDDEKKKKQDAKDAKAKEKQDAADKKAREKAEADNKADAAKKAKEYDDAKERQDKAYKSAKGRKEDPEEGKVYTGEIIGEGTSKRKSEDTSSKKSTFETIYMDYEDTPVSSDSFSGFITAGNQVLALLGSSNSNLPDPYRG
jgi:hypothetical protein